MWRGVECVPQLRSVPLGPPVEGRAGEEDTCGTWRCFALRCPGRSLHSCVGAGQVRGSATPPVPSHGNCRSGRPQASAPGLPASSAPPAEPLLPRGNQTRTRETTFADHVSRPRGGERGSACWGGENTGCGHSPAVIEWTAGETPPQDKLPAVPLTHLRPRASAPRQAFPAVRSPTGGH